MTERTTVEYMDGFSNPTVYGAQDAVLGDFQEKIPADFLIVGFQAVSNTNTDASAGLKRILTFKAAPYSSILVGTLIGAVDVSVQWGNCDFNACGDVASTNPERFINWQAPQYFALAALNMHPGERCLLLTQLGSVDVRIGDHKAENIVWVDPLPGDPFGGGIWTAYEPRCFIVGFKAWKSDNQGWGVRAIQDIKYRGVPYVTQNLITSVGCCSGDYATNSATDVALKGACRIVGLLNAQGNPTEACRNVMFTHCQGDNLVQSNCLTFCRANDNYCDAKVTEWCQADPERILTHQDICGCFQGTEFYQNYYADLYNRIPALSGLPQLPYCSFPPCAAITAIKPQNLKEGNTPVCPNLTTCVQQVNFNTNGTITGDVGINTNISSCGGLVGTGTGTFPITSTGTGTTATNNESLSIGTIALIVMGGIVGLGILGWFISQFSKSKSKSI